MTSFIKTDCGAGSSGLTPSPPSASTLRCSVWITQQTTAADVMTPIISPICWNRGVAPRTKPVFRSCEVSPAIEAAMQTAVPTINAVALPSMLVQMELPDSCATTRKIRLVPSNAAIVMPDVGLEVTPTRPTMRDDTVTKKKAKIAINTAASARAIGESM